MLSVAAIRCLEYFLAISYYLTKFAKNKRRRGRGADGDEDDADDPADPGFGDTDPLDIPGEPAGRWMGAARFMLGLAGVVLPTHLKRLLRGLHPKTQEPLVRSARRVKPRGKGTAKRKKSKARPAAEGKKERSHRPGWDLTFSPSKNLSVAWAIGNRERRESFECLTFEALDESIEFFTPFVCTRRRKGKDIQEIQGVPLVAAFQHSASREDQPQLHIHALLLNIVGLKDGTFGALHSERIYHKKMLIGAYFRQALVYKLRTKLGLVTERRGTSFGLRGPAALETVSDHFSERSRQIKKHCQDRGENSARAKEKAALATRKKKGEELGQRPRRELFERWKAEAQALGLTGDDIENMMGEPLSVDPDAPKKCVDAAIEELVQERSHFSRRALKRRALYVAADYTVHPDAVLGEVKKRLKDDPEIEFLIDENGYKRYSTKKRLAEEKELLDIARRLGDRPQHIVSTDRLEKVLRTRPTIRPDQAEALIHLAAKPSSIRILKGPAGSGKTFVLEALAECFGGLLGSDIARILRGSPRREKSSIQEALTEAAQGLLGLRLIAAAPTGKATDILAQATGIKEAYTLDVLLGDFGQDITAGQYALKTVQNLAKAARKKRTFRPSRPKPIPLDRNTVVIVDEASMMGFGQAMKLLRLVEKAGATLILIGDDFQKPPIGSQPIFTSLSEYVGSRALKVVTRQNAKWARDAVQDLQDGKVEAALEAFHKHGRLAVVEDALHSMVHDWWLHAASDSVDDALILARTNSQVEELNDLCQETLRRNGRLHGPEVKIVDRQRGRTYSATVQIGDRVTFTRNSNKYRDGIVVRNGTRGTVVGASGRKISVRLDAPREYWKVQVAPNTSAPLVGLGHIHGMVTCRESEGQYFFAGKKRANAFVKTLAKNNVQATLYAPKKQKRRTITVSTKKFPHIRRAYATTDFKAQGDTIRFIFVLLGQDHPSSYVQTSRHANDCFLYVPADLWREIAPGKRPIVHIMKERPDLRLATDLRTRHELATFFELTDRLFSSGQHLYVRMNNGGPFTWEPAEVIEQKNTLDLRVISEHTGNVLRIPRQELKDRVQLDLTDEAKKALSTQLVAYNRAQDFIKHPLEPGDKILYGGYGRRYVPADGVKERREDGSVVILLGVSEIEISADEIPTRIIRVSKWQDDQKFLRNARRLSGRRAPAAKREKVPASVTGRPFTPKSLSPTPETSPENILCGTSQSSPSEADKPGAGATAKPKPVVSTTGAPEASTSKHSSGTPNILRATYKPASQKASQDTEKAELAKPQTDKKSGEAAQAEQPAKPTVLKANVSVRDAASTPAAQKTETTSAAQPTSNVLQANYKPPSKVAEAVANTVGTVSRIGDAARSAAAAAAHSWTDKSRADAATQAEKPANPNILKANSSVEHVAPAAPLQSVHTEDTTQPPSNILRANYKPPANVAGRIADAAAKCIGTAAAAAAQVWTEKERAKATEASSPSSADKTGGHTTEQTQKAVANETRATDHGYSLGDRVYVEGGYGSLFTWEPGSVVSLDPFVTVLTDYTRSRIEVYSISLDESLRRELPFELDSQLWRQKYFFDNPLRVGDVVEVAEYVSDDDREFVKARIVRAESRGDVLVETLDGRKSFWVFGSELARRVRPKYYTSDALDDNAEPHALQSTFKESLGGANDKVSDHKSGLSDLPEELQKLRVGDVVKYDGRGPYKVVDILKDGVVIYLDNLYKRVTVDWESAKEHLSLHKWLERLHVGDFVKIDRTGSYEVLGFLEEGVVIYQRQLGSSLTIDWETAKERLSLDKMGSTSLWLYDRDRFFRERDERRAEADREKKARLEPEPVPEPEPEMARNSRDDYEPLVYTSQPLDTPLSKLPKMYSENTPYPAALTAQMPGCPTPGAAEQQIWTTNQQKAQAPPPPPPMPQLGSSTTSSRTVETHVIPGAPQKQAN